MKVVVAMDSFKGSLTSMEAGNAVARGISRVYPSAKVIVRPLADGGEGTVDALVPGLLGSLIRVCVTGPLGAPVTAVYGIFPQQGLAVMEMAAAAGLTLVPENQRNPMAATTYGVGEMIVDAIDRGCRRFIIGLGGSATNDGGVGMLKALGFGFFDGDGRPVESGASGLERLCTVTCDQVIPKLWECEFMAACDVTNGLCGPRGCSAVFGPQKGAAPDMISKMDKWLGHYAALSGRAMGIDGVDGDFPGAGAAGGMGFALKTFLNARLEPGISLILKETHFCETLEGADIVVTGEGRLDGQTVMGKAPAGVAALAKAKGIPVLAFSGCVTEDAKVCNAHGIDAFFPVVPAAMSLAAAMDTENAKNNLANTAEQVFRLWRAAKL